MGARGGVPFGRKSGRLPPPPTGFASGSPLFHRPTGTPPRAPIYVQQTSFFVKIEIPAEALNNIMHLQIGV